MKKAEWKKLKIILKPFYSHIIAILAIMFLATTVTLLIPLIQRELMDQGFVKLNFQVIVQLSLVIFALYILYQLVEITKEVLRTRVKANLSFSLYENAFNHILRLKTEFINLNASELLNILSTDIANISMLADDTIVFAFTQILYVFGGTIGLFIINWQLALLVLFFIPIKYLVISLLAIKRRQLIENSLKANANFAQWFETTVLGIKEIRLFNLSKIKENEFKKYQKNSINIDRKISLLTSSNIIFDQTLVEFLTTMIYIIGGSLLLDQKISIGSVFAFVSYIVYVTTPIAAIFNIKLMLSGVFPSINRYTKFINLEEEKDLGNLLIKKKSSAPIIQFKNVSFVYSGNDNNTISNMNFYIDEGEKVAIVGANGAGKSTLLQLIFRFCKPSSGSIEMYGNNIENYLLSEYRNYFAVVNQEVYLFEGSIEYNICLTKHPDKYRLEQAVVDANLYEMIKEKSLSYNVGNNGENLSGGQKQKIALARALYSNRNLFIFDEATANLDTITVSCFCELLQKKLHNKTVIVVTHTDTLLQYMNKIIFLEHGKIKSICNQLGSDAKAIYPNLKE